MADSSLESNSGAIGSCEVSVQDCLDRLAELNKSETAQDISAFVYSVRGCIGGQGDAHTKRHHVCFSGPGRPNPMLHNIISELLNYLVRSYEDRYDETKAIIEQDMAVSKGAVQERFAVEDFVIK